MTVVWLHGVGCDRCQFLVASAQAHVLGNNPALGDPLCAYPTVQSLATSSSSRSSPQPHGLNRVEASSPNFAPVPPREKERRQKAALSTSRLEAFAGGLRQPLRQPLGRPTRTRRCRSLCWGEGPGRAPAATPCGPGPAPTGRLGFSIRKNEKKYGPKASQRF